MLRRSFSNLQTISNVLVRRKISIPVRVNKYSTENQPERTVDETDVLIVGAGPSGLASAIRLKQLAKEKQRDIRVVVLEKGGEVGSHILSGALLDPRGLNELLPNWKDLNAPISTSVVHDTMKFLTAKYAIKLPLPPDLDNTGNYIVSLSDTVKWLGEHAESLGVEIYSGIAGTQMLINEKDGKLEGIATNDVGISKTGKKKSNYERGMAMKSRLTILAEGCHGSLTKKAIQQFNLRKDGQFQAYGLGVKEIWQIDPSLHEKGKVYHTVGWPLNYKTYGGSFMYHADNNLVYLGLIVGLDYQNPYISPYHELQRWKHHPFVSSFLKGGKCISYGARALNEGGLQSVPKLAFPGGVLVGCTAGFMNVAKLKGSHTAIKSGMLAAESAFDALNNPNCTDGPLHLTDYEDRIKSSWIWEELWKSRNFKPAFKYSLYGGLLYGGFEGFLSKGRVPWTLKHHAPDYACLKPANQFTPIDYPKPDNVLSFSLLDNLSRSGTNHEEDQPSHLTLKNAEIPTTVNLPIYGGPESRYCPAQVYEFVDKADEKVGSTTKILQINAQNCLHCKTCDIKDPSQNINWVPPEGGGGPQYSGT